MITILLLLFDLLSVASGLLLSIFLRFGVLRLPLLTFIVFGLITVGMFYIDGLYDHKLYADKTRLFFRLQKNIVAIFIIYVFIGFLFKFSLLVESRFVIVLSVLFIDIFISFLRLALMDKILVLHYQAPKRRNPLFFRGDTARFEDVKNFFDEKCQLGFLPSLKTSSSPAFLWSDSHSYKGLYEDIISLLGKKPLQVVSPLFSGILPNWDWGKIEGFPVIEFVRRENRARQVLKRFLDIFIASVLLVILSPLFIILSIAVKLSGPGPVFFRQSRMGKEKEFVMFKFRTMLSGGEDEREEKFRDFINGTLKEGKIVKETMVTTVGRFLRKTSLDELPQLFNVVKGDMSLVGPRPPIPYEFKHYKKWHKDRLSATPGMTGLWQIYGRGRLKFDASTFLDIFYAINHSTSMDLKILFLTVPVVVFGIGAR